MYGDRVPGLWLEKDNSLLIASAINGDPNYFRSTSKPIQVNKWYSVEIEQGLQGEKVESKSKEVVKNLLFVLS